MPRRKRERFGSSAVFSTARRAQPPGSGYLADYIGNVSGFGTQALSSKRSAETFTFGSEARTKAFVDDGMFSTPGPRYIIPDVRSDKAPRFADAPSEHRSRSWGVPGPKYTIPSTIGSGPRHSFAVKHRHEMPPTDLDAPTRAECMGFGFGCSPEEHALYGRCLDGMCSKRARWEVSRIKK